MSVAKDKNAVEKLAQAEAGYPCAIRCAIVTYNPQGTRPVTVLRYPTAMADGDDDVSTYSGQRRCGVPTEPTTSAVR